MYVCVVVVEHKSLSSCAGAGEEGFDSDSVSLNLWGVLHSHTQMCVFLTLPTIHLLPFLQTAAIS